MNFESRSGYNDDYSFSSGGGLHLNPNNVRAAPVNARNVSAPSYPMYHGGVTPQPAGPGSRFAPSSVVQSPAQFAEASFHSLPAAHVGGGALAGQFVGNVQQSGPHSSQSALPMSSLSSLSSLPLGTSLINRSSSAPTASLLVERRVEHLEENVRSVKDELGSLIASMKEGTRVTEIDASVGSWMHATVVHATVEYLSLDDDIANVVLRVTPTPVPEGVALSVSYPMHRVHAGERDVIVMRRRMVDNETAQISGSWVIVNVPGAEPSTLVSNFAF
jgi:hypothetical protein